MDMEKIYEALNKLNQGNNNLRRWTSFITKGSHDEISKQALNSAICYMLAVEVQKAGLKVNFNLFPKIAIYRSFQKVYVNYDIPEHILEEICYLEKLILMRILKLQHLIQSEMSQEKSLQNF